MTKPNSRTFKNAAYAHLAEVGKALSSPARLEILELLAQAPRTVEVLDSSKVPGNLDRAVIDSAERVTDEESFAQCDRGTDLADCIAMAPTAAELKEAEPWLSEQDANPMWPDHVRATLDDLRGRLGHGV